MMSVCITPCAIFASHRAFTRPDRQAYPWDGDATFVNLFNVWSAGHPYSVTTETQGARFDYFELELDGFKERASNAAAAQAASVAELKHDQQKVRQITCTTAKRRPRSPARLPAHCPAPPDWPHIPSGARRAADA